MIFDWSDEQIALNEAAGMPVHQRAADGTAELYDTAKVVSWTASGAVVKALLKKWQS